MSAKSWRHGQCDRHGDEQGKRVRHRQGLEERPGQTLQEEDRRHRQHLDQCRVDDGVANFKRGEQDDVSVDWQLPSRRCSRSRRTTFSCR